MSPAIPEIIILDDVGSTNNYAMGLIKNNRAVHGTSIFSGKQTRGKGRLEKRWESDPGKNIALSVITDMQSTPIHFQPYFSMWVSLCVSGFIEKVTNLKAFVKWPNDIFLHDRKAAGILIENVLRGSLWQWAITGVGMNVNQDKFSGDYRATSLKLETGKEFDILGLASGLRDSCLAEFPKYIPAQPALVLKLYNEKLYKRGESVKFQSGNKVFESIIKGVNKQGKLITEDTLTREWNMDEIKMKV